MQENGTEIPPATGGRPPPEAGGRPPSDAGGRPPPEAGGRPPAPEEREGSPPNYDTSCPVLHVVVVGFHHKKGCQGRVKILELRPVRDQWREGFVIWDYMYFVTILTKMQEIVGKLAIIIVGISERYKTVM